jgi:hypothetical protein
VYATQQNHYEAELMTVALQPSYACTWMSADRRKLVEGLTRLSIPFVEDVCV